MLDILPTLILLLQFLFQLLNLLLLRCQHCGLGVQGPPQASRSLVVTVAAFDLALSAVLVCADNDATKEIVTTKHRTVFIGASLC
jgi:hypothetical protein